jgi:hypothetical protein
MPPSKYAREYALGGFLPGTSAFAIARHSARCPFIASIDGPSPGWGTYLFISQRNGLMSRSIGAALRMRWIMNALK